MQTSKESQDAIHRIDPESSEEISSRFEVLVGLLENGTDQAITSHLQGFHHSDLADAVGLITGNLRRRLLGLVKIEFRHFPLDIAAFNASKVSQCNNDGDSKILNSLYANQQKWVKGSSAQEANENLQKFLVSEGYSVDFNKCINDKEIEDFVLNDRIDGVKKYKVNATPTIIINNKKFEKTLNYKNLKKALEKLI